MSSIFGRDGHKYRAPAPPPAPPPSSSYDAPRYDSRDVPPARKRGGFSFISIAGVLIWTVFAYFGYVVIDIGLNWLSASGDAVLASGRDLGVLVGAGKEVGAMVDGVRSSGLLQQIVSLVRMLLIPAMLVIWFLGVIALMILPRIFGKVLSLVSSRR